MKKISFLLTAAVLGIIALTAFAEFKSTTQSDISYEEIIIGNQMWMSKNLDVEVFSNGDSIPQAKSRAEWVKANDERKPAWCYYENDRANGVKYGKLYNWFAVNDQRGLAPKGWHIPSDAEWNQLIEFLGGSEVAGNKLKSIAAGTWHEGATNESSFSGLPGGYRSKGGSFSNIGDNVNWWSSTEVHANSAWNRLVGYSNRVYRLDSSKKNGFSVRCLRD
jgi:uncharacterized protein (TIGR02145 family)